MYHIGAHRGRNNSQDRKARMLRFRQNQISMEANLFESEDNTDFSPKNKKRRMENERILTEYSLSKMQYKEDEHSEEIINQLICPICQCVMESPVMIMRCQHAFCHKCLLLVFVEKGQQMNLASYVLTPDELGASF